MACSRAVPPEDANRSPIYSFRDNPECRLDKTRIDYAFFSTTRDRFLLQQPHDEIWTAARTRSRQKPFRAFTSSGKASRIPSDWSFFPWCEAKSIQSSGG